MGFIPIYPNRHAHPREEEYIDLNITFQLIIYNTQLSDQIPQTSYSLGNSL